MAIWLLLTVAFFALAMTGFGGQSLFDRLHSGEPRVPGSESEAARQLIDEHVAAGDEITLTVLDVDLSDPEQVTAAGQAAGTLHSQVLAVDGVSEIVTPFVFDAHIQDPQAAPIVSADADGFLVIVTLANDLTADATSTTTEQVNDYLRAFPQSISSEASGIISSVEVFTDEIITQVQHDLITGELVALPISLLIMVVVFGGFLTAGMPLAGAVASIGGGLGALLGFSHLIDLDSVVVNVVTVLGLGLSIDYGLLIVSRFREELHTAQRAELAQTSGGAAGRRRRRTRTDPVVLAATRATLRTAGRTVAYSALIVAISVSGLLLLRPEILRSLSAAGLAVVLIALATALTLVPALLVLLGRRMLRPPLLARVRGLRRVVGALGDVAPQEGFFSRLAGGVQRRPWWVLVIVSALLLLMAAPLLGLQLRNSTTDLLPTESEQRDVTTIWQQDYPLVAEPTMSVLAEGSGDQVATLSERIEGLAGVAAVDPPEAIGADHHTLGVRAATDDAGGPAATELVGQIRDLRASSDMEFWTYGQAPNQVDFTEALWQGLPWAAGVVILATFALLFAMTGSLLVPAKALVVNLLSIAASLGLTTWIFQDGHLEGLLGFTSVGGLESYVVAVVVAFGFGLAMDYEVFLLARIKELYDGHGDNDRAVRYGLQRSGRIITSAALVLMVVFGGFVAGDLLVIKQVGVALAITVAIDATLVRMLLVPATMTLLGHRNWWAAGAAAPAARAFRHSPLTTGVAP